MSRKEKSLHEKVKHFFGKKESVPVSFDKLRKELHILTLDTLKDIRSDNSLYQRLKCLKDLYEIVLTKKLEKHAVEALCKNIEDLIDSQNSIETRHIVFQFYNALILGQVEYMDTMRGYLFRLLMQHKIQEDILPCLEMLKALTECGRNISYFEEEIGPFLLQWFPDVIAAEKTPDFLSLVANVIKFNAAYLDDSIIFGYIEYTSVLCSRTKLEDDIEECLNILDAVLCFSHLPDFALQHFIYTLCLTVNVEKFSQYSWKQMRNLLGTNVGHTCIFSLCLILQEKINHKQSALLRGAIFFIGMALWGSNKVAALIHPPTAVLPSFLKALESKDSIIAYEIILSLQRLLKNGSELQSLCWDIIFDIIENILEYSELQDANDMSVLAKAVHDLITAVEETACESSYERLYKIVERCSHSRNESSVIRLIMHKVELMSPFQADFLNHYHILLEKYFRCEKRPIIQLELLQVVRHIRQNYIHFFEADLLDQIILQYVNQLDCIPDIHTRKAAVELLVDIGNSCAGSWFVDVIDSLEKVMKLFFENLPNSAVESDPNTTTDQYVDVLVAVKGLIDMFKKKLFVMPSNHCLAVYLLLTNHVKQHFTVTSYISDVINIRKIILEFLLDIKVNNEKRIGISVGTTVAFSVYVSCDLHLNKEINGSIPLSPSPCSPLPSGYPTVSCLSYGDAFQALILCLKQEKDWAVLEMVLCKLLKLLQNKALVILGKCSISTLASTLCCMVNDRNMGLPENLRNAPSRLTRTDIQGCIYPCVAALTSYHSYLESHIQRLLIRCLQSGLVSRSAKLCIDGLMLCSLEMQNSMLKLLPDVLLKLSKISATVGVAISVLEFLSNLIRLPHLYVSFVEDQYMSIFAIALPYTNPFKFNQYIVALAHHVIAMWFLKCRIPFRKDFAKFISKGLSSNICLPHEENESMVHQSDDSSQSQDKSLLSNNAVIALHTELMETGLDLMARFTFGMSSNVPKRSPVSEFLLEKGQKSSWLVGNKIITITTSGCNTKSFKNGLCERCYNLCLEFSKNSDPYEADSIFQKEENNSVFVKEESMKKPPDFPLERKRHRSAIQRRNTMTKDILSSSSQAKDDILLHFSQLQSLDSFRDEVEVPDDGFSFLKTNKDKEDKQGHLCNCWCTNWAEVHIRRPTGNTSWLMKIQNQISLPTSPPDVPLSVLTSMVLQGPWGHGPDSSLLFPVQEDYLESETLNEESTEGAVDISICEKTNPPMRRTNSSPDMNVLWTNPLTQDSEQNKHLSESFESDKGSLFKTETESSGSGVFPSFHPGQRNNPEKSASRKTTMFRDRGHTISVMSPIHPKVSENPNQKLDANRRSGMNPSFVFLQLYHNSCIAPVSHKPLLLLQTEANNRALNVLDHIPPYDTHKIGIVFVGPSQATDEISILSNVYGSARYVGFLQKLGNLVRLTDVDPQTTYLGGLDTRGEDGKFALIWHDDVMQVVFHVATLMINKDNDPMRTEKKKHIANDSVVIVYNESGEDYNFSTIKGHVTNACVIISPEDFNNNLVSVKLKTKELSEMFDHSESYIISDDSLPVFVRQLALHANLASLIISRRQQLMKYSHVSNWLERLRTIKRLRSKVIQEMKDSSDSYENTVESNAYDNFTDYV